MLAVVVVLMKKEEEEHIRTFTHTNTHHKLLLLQPQYIPVSRHTCVLSV